MQTAQSASLGRLLCLGIIRIPFIGFSAGKVLLMYRLFYTVYFPIDTVLYLFNVFFVLGSSAAITPLPMGNIGNFDLGMLIGSSLLFWLFGWLIKQRTITRLEGVLMVACYVGYTVFLVMQA